jgi:hypothetical protein
MDDREEEAAPKGRTRRVHNAGGQHKHIVRAEGILLVEHADGYFTFKDVDGDWSAGAVCWEFSARANGHDSEPKWSFLNQRPGAPSMPGEKRRVNQALLLGQMMDSDIAVKRPAQ